jgi:pSer/pThr/pTyr-binding forkhead associated (FHA) protein/DNA-directed RNA polymerase subunit RPC12/RpoP
VTVCAFCGRENDEASRFCIDCGKPVNPSAARVQPAYVPSPSGDRPAPAVPVAHTAPRAAGAAGGVAAGVGGATAGRSPVASGGGPHTSGAVCPRCGKTVNADMPFCAHCGARVLMEILEPGSCSQCGASYTKGVDLFCARCGNRVGERVSVAGGAAAPPKPVSGTMVVGSSRMQTTAAGPRLALLSEVGEVAKTFTLERGEAVIGRGDADIKFERDHFMSPLHARIDLREGSLCLRDLGSRNGTWVFVDQPVKLTDCDLMLVGSQLIRFRRLGYPGPHPPEADSTRRMGSSVPTVDIAVMEQIRADGSVRDVFHLSPGRTVAIGREDGDWLFPYDQTMSGRHAEVRSEDSEFYLQDAGSRNGVAMAVRGERSLKEGQRILIGDQILRVESI